uniref:Nucleotide-diphospho-sugar transferase n=1 Tax=Ignavibacterium album TaxID=591197 RepID=A0A832G8Q5_9BACT
MGHRIYYETKSPLLFLTFNRLDTTKKVFEVIKQVKPPKLYLASDGARGNKSGEKEVVESVRNFLLNNIDWQCDVKTLFREQNLGCGKAVSSAINWFFKNEEMGIILEDDCLPSISFFRFCDELLIRYKDDERIMHISGDNFQDGISRGDGSYYFSQISHVWGWAAWRRAWKLYDFEMKSLNKFINCKIYKSIWKQNKVQKYWLKQFKNVSLGKIDTWDYQWNYCLIVNNGLSILPNINLVENIGFNSEATHTSNSKLKMPSANEIKFPLTHPQFFVPDLEADTYTFNKHYQQSLLSKIKGKLKNILK